MLRYSSLPIRVIFGRWGIGIGCFINPSGIAVDLKGRILVADNGNHRIQIFSSNGEFIKEFGGLGSKPMQFKHPSGIAVNSKNEILVADTDNHRIQIFDSEGEEVISDFYGFNNPSGITVDSKDEIFVTDEGTRQIIALQISGEIVTRFGSSVFSGIRICHKDRLIVTNNIGHKVNIFDYNGDPIKEFGCEGSGPGQFKNPTGIAIDSKNRIIVADTNNHRIQIFGSNEEFITGLGSEGSRPGQFHCPNRIGIDSRDRILITDTLNNRIQILPNLGFLIERDAFLKMSVEYLLKEFDGEFIALLNGHVVVHDENEDDFYETVFKKYGDEHLYIKKINRNSLKEIGMFNEGGKNDGIL